MNKKQRVILKLEEDFVNNLVNEIEEGQNENKKVVITNVKFVGRASWEDFVSGKMTSESVFIVERELIEIDDDGRERKTRQDKVYLGNEAVAGRIGFGEFVYDNSFRETMPDKFIAVDKLLESVSEIAMENYSLDVLSKMEAMEILSAYLGREVSDVEVEKLFEQMEMVEAEQNGKDHRIEENSCCRKTNGKEKTKDELSEDQAKMINLKAIQRADLNISVDGTHTLGQRLDLQEYDSLYIVYSENVNEINPETKRNNTTYSLVGMTKDGNAKVLNDEFEMDKSVGCGASRMSTKIRSDGTATRDNKDLSVFTRKSNGMGIGCENNRGTVSLSLYQKTKKKNENVGIPIQTSNVGSVSSKIKELGRISKGTQNIDDIQDEVVRHTENGCVPDQIEDFDGKEDTFSDGHLPDEMIDDFVEDILDYKNSQGEECIREIFSDREVKDKLLRELKESENKGLSVEHIIENIKEEMNEDAELFIREHNR